MEDYLFLSFCSAIMMNDIDGVLVAGACYPSWVDSYLLHHNCTHHVLSLARTLEMLLTLLQLGANPQARTYPSPYEGKLAGAVYSSQGLEPSIPLPDFFFSSHPEMLRPLANHGVSLSSIHQDYLRYADYDTACLLSRHRPVLAHLSNPLVEEYVQPSNSLSLALGGSSFSCSTISEVKGMLLASLLYGFWIDKSQIILKIREQEYHGSELLCLLFSLKQGDSLVFGRDIVPRLDLAVKKYTAYIPYYEVYLQYDEPELLRGFCTASILLGVETSEDMEVNSPVQ